MTIAEELDIKTEQEHNEWRKSPLWYCVKTKFYNSGKIESEIMRDEKTKLPIAIQSFGSPLDGSYDDKDGTIYYTYHRGYEAAANHLLALSV